MPGPASPNINFSASWGPNDPEVESIWILLKHAVDKIEDAAIKDEADFRADRLYEKLVEARNHYMQISNDDFVIRPSSEKSALYNSLYSALWSAYKNRFKEFTAAIGYAIEPFFAGDTQYEPQMSGFVARYPEHAQIKDFIDIQKRSWQNVLQINRNSNEHDGDFRNYLDLPNLENIEYAKQIFKLVCRTIEMLGISFLSYKIPEYWNVVTLNINATVFDREPRYEIRSAAERQHP